MNSGMTGTDNLDLVTLSFAIAVFVYYAVLDLPRRADATARQPRLLWLLGAAVAMGSGIGSMHFMVVLAFQLPQPVHYKVSIVLLSFACAIIASGIALWLLSRAISIPLLMGGGVGMGIGIAWMHDTGTAVMHLMVTLLSRLGFEVRVASDRAEAIAIWEARKPHAIWMDMRMPVMDEYETAKPIKAQLKGQATTIIALTASAFEEERQTILSVVSSNFSRKPFREEELLAKMSQHLGVESLYESEVPPNANKTLSSSASDIALQMANVPTEWVQKLYEAASQCSNFLMLQLLDSSHKKDFSARKLNDLVDFFGFNQLRKLTQINAILYSKNINQNL